MDEEETQKLTDVEGFTEFIEGFDIDEHLTKKLTKIEDLRDEIILEVKFWLRKMEEIQCLNH